MQTNRRADTQLIEPWRIPMGRTAVVAPRWSRRALGRNDSRKPRGERVSVPKTPTAHAGVGAKTTTHITTCAIMSYDAAYCATTQHNIQCHDIPQQTITYQHIIYHTITYHRIPQHQLYSTTLQYKHDTIHPYSDSDSYCYAILYQIIQYHALQTY